MCTSSTTHSRWLKVATKRICICHITGALFSAIASHLEALAAVAQLQANMATTADLMTLQQQIRRDMADSLKRVREEMHTALNGRLDAISSISNTMQKLSAHPAETAKPHKISDLIPKSWDGSHYKGQFKNFMAELHQTEVRRKQRCSATSANAIVQKTWSTLMTSSGTSSTRQTSTKKRLQQ